jgi:hypothetical protein
VLAARTDGTMPLTFDDLFFHSDITYRIWTAKISSHSVKSDWGTLVSRINVENGIKLGFL